MSVRVDSILPPGWLSRFDPHSPRIAIGIDPATTTKKKSNPTGIVVTQQVGLFYYQRLVIRLKTDDPDVVEWLLRTILAGLRSIGLSVRRICIRATNERFFAVNLKKRLASKAPVTLLIESEKITYLGVAMLVKVYLGNLVVNTIEEGYLPMPETEWLKQDFRSVVKERGSFEAEILEDGGHGDCFDGAGAALHGLITKGGPAKAEGGPISGFNAKPAVSRKLLNPFASKFTKRSGRVMS